MNEVILWLSKLIAWLFIVAHILCLIFPEYLDIHQVDTLIDLAIGIYILGAKI